MRARLAMCVGVVPEIITRTRNITAIRTVVPIVTDAKTIITIAVAIAIVDALVNFQHKHFKIK